ARESFSPGAGPLHQVLWVLLPEGEVQGVPLVRILLDPVPGLELLDRVPAQDPVPGELRDLKVDLPGGLVGEARSQKLLDQGDHFRNVLRRARIVMSREQVE